MRNPLERIPLVSDLYALWAADARWARILEIRRMGPMAQIRLEVHDADLPPFEHWVTTWVPRGRDPQVGEDVYWVDRTGADSTSRSLAIKWKKAPNYGAAPVDTGALGDQVADRLSAAPVYAQGAALAADPLAQLECVQARRVAGELSAQEFEHQKADLLAWSTDPAAENDPAVHRARLEQRRATGEVSDAEYARRSAELGAWERGLAQVRANRGAR
jgi:hypothetical protein